MALGEVIDEKALYRSSFEQFERRLAAKGSSWIDPVRRAAIERFAEKGFPSTREERWRTTNVAPIARVPFRQANGRPSGGLEARVPERALTGASLVIDGGIRLVFRNGRLATDLCTIRELPGGVRVGSLAEAIETDREIVESHLARHARPENHAFVALNTAFIEDGGFVYVPKRTVLERPIHLIFVSSPGDEPIVSHPRNLIVAGDASCVTIVESYVGEGRGVYFTNAVTEIVAGEGAVIDHYKLQQEGKNAFHVSVSEARLDRNASFSSHSLSLGGSLVRNEVNVLMNAEGAECSLNGLFMACGSQHVDNHTTIDHAKPRCTSRELYKGILDGRSRGVFDGRIVVRPDARKTDARQTNRNLLLSEDCLVDSKPQLEILNDDVKCSHAATIGRLDEDALFYLRTRGIDRKAARILLTGAFASDVLSAMKLEPLRRALEATVSAWLADSGRGKEAR